MNHLTRLLLLCLTISACSSDPTPDAPGADSSQQDADAEEDDTAQVDLLDDSPGEVGADGVFDAVEDAGPDTPLEDPVTDLDDPSQADVDVGHDLEDGVDTAGADLADVTTSDTTTIRVHYDSKLGNHIALRGDGVGLSWTADTLTTWTAGNIWVLESDDWLEDAEIKPVFVDEDDEVTWASGTNYVIRAGETNDIHPHFFEDAGTVESFTATWTVLETTRDVAVYLPPSYYEAGAADIDRSYPVLFMHDGQNLFSDSGLTWLLKGTLDDLMTYGTIGEAVVGNMTEVIVVAPHNGLGNRLWEYTPTAYDCVGEAYCGEGGGGDTYLDFLEHDVLPELRSRYRTTGDSFGIAGSSLGGLISMYATWTRHDVFDRAGVFSPSLWWDDGWMTDQVNSHAGVKKPVRIYLDAGTSNDGMVGTVALDSLLQGKGYVTGQDVWCLVGDGQAHNEGAWADRAPYALHFLYADPGRVQNSVVLPGHLSQCGD